MLKTIRQTLWALRYALRAHPILVLSSFTLLTVLSFLPSAQMFLIAAITDSLSAGDAHTALTWAGVTGGVLAGNLALQQVSNSLDMSLRAVSGRSPAGSLPSPLNRFRAAHFRSARVPPRMRSPTVTCTPK